MLARRHGLIIQQVFNITRARDICAGKRPSHSGIILTCNVAIPRASHIQHMLCAIRRVEGCRAIPGSPVFKVCGVLQGTIPVFGAVDGSQSESILTGELDRGIRRVSAPEVVRCVNFRRAGERTAGAGEHRGERAACCYTIPGNGHPVWNAIFVGLRVRQLDACAALEHVGIAVRGQRSRRQFRSCCQARAAGEHVLIALRCQRSCRQFRSNCKTRAAVEHVLIAVLRQCSGRQFGSRCQARAAVEHVGIAEHGQRSGRQFGRRCQTRAVSEHAVIAPTRQRSRRQFGRCCQARAAVEHVGIAPTRQCSGRQFGCRCQASATVKHVVIAVVCQRSGRQFGRCCQTCAVSEHILVAMRCQRRRGQFGCCCQARAVVEQIAIAARAHARMLACCHGFMIQQVFNIARTGDICAGKRPALSTTAGNHTILCASHIQHMLRAIGRVKGSRAIPGSPVFEVSGVFQRSAPVLGAVGGSKCESIITTELDRGIRGVSAPEVVCSVNLRRSSKRAACATEHKGERVLCCCYTVPRNGHSVRDAVLVGLCGRQLNACAAAEHVGIAVLGQRSRRQFGGCC